MMRCQRPLAIVALAALVGCGSAADYPALLPMDQILSEPAPVSDPVAVQATLAGGAAGLRGRADALRAPVIDAATKARMAEMAARHR